MARNPATYLVADLVCLLAFALGGKSSHEASSSDWVVLEIVWPFALVCVAVHVALGLAGRRTDSVVPEGAVVVATTYVLGMLLRLVSGRGLAVGFLVVALVFLTVTMLGWRAGSVAVRSRASRRSRSGSAG